MKEDMTVQIWRELSADGRRYRLSLVAGFHASTPNVCWQEVRPVEFPLADSIQSLAREA